MRSGVRENLPAAAAAALGILLVGWLGLGDWAWNDYAREARPAFDALLGGHPLGFLRLAPAYGGSLLIRAPFVGLTRLWGGGDLAVYRMAAAPCLIASGVLAVWLVARLRSRGAPPITRLTVLGLCVANPITLLALETGHPEELLGAVLCVAAVLAAMAERPVWSGVLLGLAVANQEWAVLAAGPVWLALADRRLRALATAGALAGAILLPFALAGGFLAQVKGAAATSNLIFSPWQVWWFLGPRLHRVIASEPWATRLEPGWLASGAHPLIVAVAVPLTVLCAWLRRRGARRPAHEPLLALAVLLLARCVLDPWNNWYYPLPFLIALLVWEVQRDVRPPVLALLAAGGWWWLTQWATPAHGFSADQQSLVFLAIAGPAAVAALLALYAPGLGGSLRSRLTRRVPHPSPA
jgi:hypothetical protein